jgi:predicted permease
MRDLRYAWRLLRKSPVFTLTAVLSLGLGIGAAVTMFSAFRSVFLRSLPYRDADRIVQIEKHGGRGDTGGVTLADFEFLRRNARSFETVAWFSGFEQVTLSRPAEPANLWVRSVSRELFPLLGSQQLLGRTLAASDFEVKAPPAVVLSYGAWRKNFHGDPHIIGRQILLNEQYPKPGKTIDLVVGVMPKEFYFPQAGITAWLPYRTPVSDPLRMGVSMLARLRREDSMEQARSEIHRLLPALERGYPEAKRGWLLSLDRFGARSIEEYRKAFALLLAAAGFLVLIACLNVANLLLARASARATEFAIRGALGASRRRLVGQVLIESLALAGLGGAAGVGLAYAGNRVLLWLLPVYLGIPRLEETRLDSAVLGIAVLLALLAGLLFGLAPAFALSKNRLAAVDRERRSGSANSWFASGLLMSEVGISLILLAGAMLMMRGFVRLASVDPGFRTAHVLTAGVPPGHIAGLSRAQLVERYSEILNVARNVPGVEQAALTSALPMGNIVVGLTVYLPDAPSDLRLIDFHAVSAEYFSIMGLPLLQGRFFGPFDANTDKGAVIVNRAMADKYWPGRNAIGQRFSSERPPALPDLRIVGIVGNTRHRSLSGEPVPEFYQPYQSYFGPTVGTTLVLRAFGNPNSVASSLRRAIRRFDGEQVVENEKTMEATVEQSIATPRFYTILLTIFALLAFALTLVGVYGVASYGMSLRSREFGIRIGLGAQRHQLIGMVLRRGLLRALVGVGAGAAGAWALARLMSGMVYGISVRDPVSLGIAGAVLIAGALVAYYLPARRTARIDPAVILRQE